MFIDIHAHVYRAHPPVWVPFCTPEQLIRRYDEEGIEKGILLPIVSPEIYLPQSNEEVLGIVEEYPDRFVAFCNIDPRALTNSPDAPLDRLLRYYRDRGCRGLGEVMPNLALMDPLVQNLFRHARDVGFPVIFDGSDRIGGDFGLYDDPGLPQLEHTLQRFPDLRIFGHGPVFWSEIAKLETPGERGSVFFMGGGSPDLPATKIQAGYLPRGPVREEGVVPKLLRKYPNLYGDLSDYNPYNALARDPAYGSAFLDEFQDRLFFGTDIVLPDMPLPLGGLLVEWRDQKKISREVFSKITRENAVKFFEL